MSQFKKKTIPVVLTILLIATLAACAQDTTIEDYLELEGAFRVFNDGVEFTYTSETRFELQSIEGAVLYVTTTQIRVDGISEMIETHEYRDQNGVHICTAETILSGGRGYFDIEFIMTTTLDDLFFDEYGMELFEFVGISREELLYEEILGGFYTHMQVAEDEFQEIYAIVNEVTAVWKGLYGAFTVEALRSYLSRSDNGFRIEVRGESVGAYFEALLEEFDLGEMTTWLMYLERVADIDDRLWHELESNFASWLRGADLTNAWFVVERAKLDENMYHQKIELYVPNRASITTDGTIAVGMSTPIVTPSRFITEDELLERIDIWMIDLILAVMQGDGHDPALIGTWVWDYNYDYEYVFGADGMATGGFTDETFFFAWQTTEDGVLLMSDGPFTERWLYTIDGNVLTLSSLDIPGMVFSYIRVE